MPENYDSKDYRSESDNSGAYPSESYVPDFYSSVQLLPIRLPVEFDQSLGLRNPARWLGLYWEPQLNQVCYTDGETVGTGNAQSWQLFCTHSHIEPILAPYQLGNDGHSSRHALLLDRQSQRLYVGESNLVDDYLRHPESLDLLAELDAPLDRSWYQSMRPWRKHLTKASKDKRLLFLLGLPAIIIASRLLHEVGEFIFELPKLWRD